jgi:predicted SAM-dependent methyltransferase
MKTKIAMGCGWRNYGPDWIHIDGERYGAHIDPTMNIDLFGVETASIDLLYASHFIAYFSKERAKELFVNWSRVLKKDGVLRIATPDFKALHRVYDLTRELSMITGPLYGKMKMGGEYIFHKTVYDFASLTALLAESGYTEFERYDWRTTEHAEVDDHSQAYMLPRGDKENGILVSLNVQCKKTS